MFSYPPLTSMHLTFTGSSVQLPAPTTALALVLRFPCRSYHHTCTLALTARASLCQGYPPLEVKNKGSSRQKTSRDRRHNSLVNRLVDLFIGEDRGKLTGPWRTCPWTIPRILREGVRMHSLYCGGVFCESPHAIILLLAAPPCCFVRETSFNRSLLWALYRFFFFRLCWEDLANFI